MAGWTCSYGESYASVDAGDPVPHAVHASLRAPLPGHFGLDRNHILEGGLAAVQLVLLALAALPARLDDHVLGVLAFPQHAFDLLVRRLVHHYIITWWRYG